MMKQVKNKFPPIQCSACMISLVSWKTSCLLDLKRRYFLCKMNYQYIVGRFHLQQFDIHIFTLQYAMLASIYLGRQW